MTKIILHVLSLFTLSSFAQAVNQADVVSSYAVRAYAKYTEALKGAEKIQQAVDRLLTSPNETTLKNAREAWIEARKSYSETEAYRFYGGPIDSDNGPEGYINAWPLDELYVDNIIADKSKYPVIDANVLRDANEKEGDKNISTGYHAIEFMLWGQDSFADGPGRRPASDFDPATSPLAERRAQYLRTITNLLIKDLQSVQFAWDLRVDNGYADEFVKKGSERNSLKNIFTGLIKLAGAELSQERMFVALDTKSQEEEHSCFSDTTHLDILHNFIGIKNILNDGLLDLIMQKDKSVAAEIDENLHNAETAIRSIPPPFDQAIVDPTKRKNVMDAISALEILAESLKQGAVTLGVDVP